VAATVVGISRRCADSSRWRDRSLLDFTLSPGFILVTILALATCIGALGLIASIAIVFRAP
jgi:hypothetical protein